MYRMRGTQRTYIRTVCMDADVHTRAPVPSGPCWDWRLDLILLYKHRIVDLVSCCGLPVSASVILDLLDLVHELSTPRSWIDLPYEKSVAKLGSR